MRSRPVRLRIHTGLSRSKFFLKFRLQGENLLGNLTAAIENK